MRPMRLRIPRRVDCRTESRPRDRCSPLARWSRPVGELSPSSSSVSGGLRGPPPCQSNIFTTARQFRDSSPPSSTSPQTKGFDHHTVGESIVFVVPPTPRGYLHDEPTPQAEPRPATSWGRRQCSLIHHIPRGVAPQKIHGARPARTGPIAADRGAKCFNPVFFHQKGLIRGPRYATLIQAV